ncbi:MAG: alpha-amylase family glycosyl hydrolase [Bacteroidota bacterium]|nr:alpha-amylase family glycosyl hydrolase [Bacteroidota bacterium]
MKKFLLALIASVTCIVIHAQLLSWTPPFPTENDASQTLVITLDASKGNKGLLNHATADVYVHTGVITNLSVNATDWKYVKFNQNFNQPNAQLLATSLGNNRWSLTITGSLKTYYGVPAGETIQKIAILFRSGDGSKKQANTDGSDMYIPIYNANLAVRIDQPFPQPYFRPVAEPQNWGVGTNFSITANANKVSTIKLYHNNVLIATAAGTQTITASSTVTALGNQQIVAEANDGVTTRFDTLNIFAAPPTSPVAALPAGVRDGINYEAGNTSAILVLHAPDKKIATVIGEFNNWIEGTNYIMNQTPDRKKFWLRITGLVSGTEYAYQYKVDDSIKIADPYSEKILDPFNDQFINANTYPNLKPYPAGQSGIVSILQTASPGYTWAVNNFSRPDKRGLIVYELLLRDFVAAHNWKTLTDTLSHLKTLGINAIELLPFNEFEGNESWGYNPNFYFAPDKYYGTKNDLKRFIDTCHKNGIAVIMDIALNHSFGSSPMVQLYFDKQNNRPSANSPWFNPAAKHAFNVGYDMNHESLDTRYFTSRVIEHWLQEYKIDGFRFDLSKGFTQKQTCDAAGNNCNVNAWGVYDASRVAIWKRYYDSVQLKSPNAYAILEHFAENTEEKELADYGMMFWGNSNYNYTEAAMGYVSNSNFDYGIYTVRTWTKPHLITYMESHDEERIVYKNLNFGNSSPSYNIRNIDTALKRAALDAAFFFTIPGPKMIWQFGELGYDYSINHCPDGSVNNNCRLANKPIRWDYKTNANRKQLYDIYSKLINLRFHPWYKDAFISGSIEHSLAGAYKTIKVNADTSRLMVVGNFDVNAITSTITFPTAGIWYDYLNGNTFTATGAAQQVSLQPGEYHVYLNRNVSGNIITPVTNIPNTGNTLEAKLYPNPASSILNIEMYLPESGTVSIDILNSIGQYISGLHQSFMPKGKHQLIINQKKLNIARGNYYIRITTKAAHKILPLTIQ